MLKISNIKYKIEKDVSISYDMLIDYIYKYISKKYKVKNLCNVELVKKSLDARTSELYFVLSAVFSCSNEASLLKNKTIVKYETPKELIELNTIRTKRRIKALVVGMGPSGLFNAYILNKAGIDVTLIDKGDCVEERVKKVNNFFETGILDESSNIQFGEGGAGTFSDGKLGTNVDSPYIRFIFEKLVEFGANKDILYDAKPHVGTDVLRKVIVNLRKHLMANGVKVMFNTELVDFDSSSAKLISKGEEVLEYFDYLVLAVGHSATKVYELLKEKEVKLEPKNFAVGVRIEHLQSKINEVQYHGVYQNLGAADYKLVAHVNGRSLYTFCMCPGGYVVNASSEEGCLVTNGMSNVARDSNNANSALLVNVNVADYYQNDVLDGVKFLKKYESLCYNKYGNFIAPVQLVKDFLNDTPSTKLGDVIPSIKPGYHLGTISDVLPPFVSETLKEGLRILDKKLYGFADDFAVMTAIETRSSAPIQIKRTKDLSTSIHNVYAIGEGSGYAGGITTSAIDGIKVALQILKKVEEN